MAEFDSSTQAIPETGVVPRHVAIIMDGNGRWAKKRFLPRVAGHRKGVEAVREVVKACAERGVEYLTLFAFSSENWRRPPEEVSFLMQLFLRSLEQEVEQAPRQRHPLQGRGRPRRAFDARIVDLVRRAEELTAGNTAPHAHHRRQLRRALGHPAGRRPRRARAIRTRRSPRSAWRRTCRWPTRPSPTSSSAPAASSASPTSCCGSSPTPSSTSPTRSGRTSTPRRSTTAFASYRRRERRFGRTSEQLAEGEPLPKAG